MSLQTQGSIMLWYATVLHVWYGIVCWVAPGILYTTPLYPFFFMCGKQRWVASALLLLGALGVLTLMFCRRQAWWMLYAGMVQQIILIDSALGAVVYASLGHYADGTPHDPLHILTDQLSSIVGASCHFVALLMYHQGRAVTGRAGRGYDGSGDWDHGGIDRVSSVVPRDLSRIPQHEGRGAGDAADSAEE